MGFGTARWSVRRGALTEAAPGMRIRTVTVTDPAGREHERSYLESSDVVVIVATQGGSVLMIREFRAAVGQVVRTLPIGKVEAGEPLLDAAARELLEETGCPAIELRLAGEKLSAPGWTDQRTTVAQAEVADEPPVGRASAPGDTEEDYIVVERVPIAELPTLISSGELSDARSIAALALVLGLAADHRDSPAS